MAYANVQASPMVSSITNNNGTSSYTAADGRPYSQPYLFSNGYPDNGDISKYDSTSGSNYGSFFGNWKSLFPSWLVGTDVYSQFQSNPDAWLASNMPWIKDPQMKEMAKWQIGNQLKNNPYQGGLLNSLGSFSDMASIGLSIAGLMNQKKMAEKQFGLQKESFDLSKQDWQNREARAKEELNKSRISTIDPAGTFNMASQITRYPNLDKYDEFVKDAKKLYDINGGYIKTIELNNSNHWERIVSAENGFVCSSYYTGGQNLVSVCDKDFRTLYSFANTEEMTFAEFPYLRNPIWCSHGKIIYCNFFSSSFYVSEQNSPSVVCYNIISDRQMTHEKVLAGKWGYEDYFLTFSFDGKCIFGYMNYNKRFCRYVFDISNNDFSVFLPMDFLPQIQAYCNGYYYSLISAHDVLSIAESAKTRKDGGYDKLYELFSPFMNKITDGDNYFVLKMKKK